VLHPPDHPRRSVRPGPIHSRPGRTSPGVLVFAGGEYHPGFDGRRRRSHPWCLTSWSVTSLKVTSVSVAVLAERSPPVARRMSGVYHRPRVADTSRYAPAVDLVERCVEEKDPMFSPSGWIIVRRTSRDRVGEAELPSAGPSRGLATLAGRDLGACPRYAAPEGDAERPRRVSCDRGEHFYGEDRPPVRTWSTATPPHSDDLRRRSPHAPAAVKSRAPSLPPDCRHSQLRLCPIRRPARRLGMSGHHRSVHGRRLHFHPYNRGEVRR